MIQLTDSVWGLGPTHQGKLAEAGILSSEHLVHFCRSPDDRHGVAKKTGLPVEKLLRWTVQAELGRIPSVGPKEAYLLERVGIHSFAELKVRDAGELLDALTTANREERVLDSLPSRDRVQSWIDDAEVLTPKLTVESVPA